MSQTDSAQVGPGGVDEAMNRVLAAERDARLAVAECRAEASRLVAEAERRARALAGRSEAHIKLAQRRADAAIAQAVAGLADVGPGPVSGAGAVQAGSANAQEPPASAVETLIDEILGNGS